MPFLFYDTETTGTSTEFDQILQFGAIKTDDELNETDRFEIRSHLQGHVVPAPGALLVTGITPAQLIDPALPSHYEMTRTIAQKMKAWGAAKYVGYNSVEFDENLLRQAFYQSLLPIYATNSNGNSRGDALNILRGLYAYYPNSIAVPLNEKDKPTFKLDRLAPANGFAHEHAHDAMADVEATIFLCKLVKTRNAAFWEAMINTMAKKGVSVVCTQSELIHHTVMYFGKFYSYFLRHIGDARGTLIGFDIANNPDDYVTATPETLTSHFEQSPKALRRFFSNKHPIAIPATAEEAATQLGISADEIKRRIAVLDNHESYRNGALNTAGRLAVEKQEGAEPPAYLEKRIHENFPSRADKERMENFHEDSDWPSKLKIAETLEDDRFKQMAHRLVYEEQPDILPQSIRTELDAWKRQRVLSEDITLPWTTIPKALIALSDAQKNADTSTLETLDSLKHFCDQLAVQTTSE